MNHIVITKSEAGKILNAEGSEIGISPDLGISSLKIKVGSGIAVIAGQNIPFKEFEAVKEKACYAVEDNQLKRVAFFSEETNLFYKLLPAKDWPTITLSSTPMHRFTFVSPKKDTESKITEISPVKGNVLDTCCGLGYTAIMASKDADEVFTFERDHNVLRIAEYNPYSRQLFSSKKIRISEKNIFPEIKKFKSGFFSRILHDPPTFKYSPELYSPEFHSELFRVLKKGGILYHYCPSPQITKGRLLYPRVARQLKEAGFRGVEYHSSSSGIRALK